VNSKSESDTRVPLGRLDPAEFIERYWETEPLLVRGAFDGPPTNLKPEDLAGWACEPGVDSRIVRCRDGDRPLDVRYGPFETGDFESLPDDGWTLLVQEVDRLVPDVAGLLEAFSFIPNWRLDDVMVSYATPGGGVGPHVDNYDVFLIQGTGRRRWAFGRTPLIDERCIPGLELEVLEHFEPDDEWVLEPGDMLYLPPRLPHRGVAIEPSMTYSIGCRAPSERELLASFLEYCLEHADPCRRYADGKPRLQGETGEITPAVLDRVRSILLERLDDADAVRSWFGRFVTRSRRESSEPVPVRPPSEGALRERLEEGEALERTAIPGLAFASDERSGLRLYAGGVEYPVPVEAADGAKLLCARGRLGLDELGPHLARTEFFELIRRLLADGHLRIDQGLKRY
jgi:50S ribosomal protein L16 3-hydroxylase